MEKFIHIHAQCNAFEIFEQVPEKKAVNVLTRIRNNFEKLSQRPQFYGDRLKVKTLVVNPEIPFQYHKSK